MSRGKIARDLDKETFVKPRFRALEEMIRGKKSRDRETKKEAEQASVFQDKRFWGREQMKMILTDAA